MHVRHHLDRVFFRLYFHFIGPLLKTVCEDPRPASVPGRLALDDHCDELYHLRATCSTPIPKPDRTSSPHTKNNCKNLYSLTS